MDEIYTILPENPETDEHLRTKVLLFLKRNPNKWYNVEQICSSIGFQEKDKTKPTIRKACKELLHFDKHPIASCHAGFTYATTENIMRVFKEHMEARLKGMQRTIADINSVMGTLSEGTTQTLLTSECYMSTDRQHRWINKEEISYCLHCGVKHELGGPGEEVRPEADRGVQGKGLSSEHNGKLLSNTTPSKGEFI